MSSSSLLFNALSSCYNAKSITNSSAATVPLVPGFSVSSLTLLLLCATSSDVEMGKSALSAAADEDASCKENDIIT